jgi:hypothetical protein
MTRDEIIKLITDVVGDSVSVVRDDLELRIDRAVAAKPLPPFLPPPVWTEGTHAASAVVRHSNGIFMARRDTTSEPPGEDWLPMVVGVAGLDLRWTGERTLAMRARLSDGRHYEMIRTLAVPLVRGIWSPDTEYEEGDRVFRFGEYHALAPSKAIEPGTPEGDAVWLKVGGNSKNQKREPLALALDEEGTLTESGRPIGSLKPLITDTLDRLLAKHTK